MEGISSHVFIFSRLISLSTIKFVGFYFFYRVIISFLHAIGPIIMIMGQTKFQKRLSS